MSVSVPDLGAVFAAYERVAAEADALFARVQQLHPDCVTGRMRRLLSCGF